MVCRRLEIFASALIVLTMLPGCDKPFELDYPLAVTQRNLTLKKEGGSTHVLVYSTGHWTAQFAEPAYWGSLSRSEGEGNSDFVFDYSPNYGVARRVRIALAMGDSRDTVTLVQRGPITEASFVPEYKTIMLIRQSGTACIPVSTNVRYGIEAMKFSVQYEDEFSEPWINGCGATPDNFYFNVKENPEGMSRKAWITLALEDVTGATSNLVTSRVVVTQTKDNPSLSLRQSAVSLDGKRQNVLVPTNGNNIWAYGSSIKFDVKGNTENDVWVNDVKFTQDGLMFSLTENQTGKARAGSIGVSFEASDGKTVSATCSISQSSL